MTIPFRELMSKALCLPIVLTIVLGCRRVKEPAGTMEVITTKTGIEMVKIPEGWFDMGSKNNSPDESPVHKVWISSFWMDRFEVVQEQFKKFQISDPSHFKDPNNPLEQINWTDATLFCNERSLAEGLEPCYDEETWECNFQANGYRLPTEAEWEYACRAGTSTNFSFGNNVRNLKDHTWFAENSSDKTHLVGQKKSNPWGLYDMYGNVSEWCNDFYSENYYKNSDQKNPKGPIKGQERVLRGGAWNSSSNSCRSSYRSSDPSIDDTCLASDAIGFRCVRNASIKISPEENMVKDKQARETLKTGLVYDDIYLEHKTTPGHPETTGRLVAITERLKASGLYSQLIKLSPKPVSSEWLTMVHSPEYIQRVRRSCQDNAGYLDSMDVPISTESYEAALMAAGGVLSAIDAVVEKKVTNAFCAIRPPGHHSLKDKAMGFCIFNNIAVGAKYIQKKHNLSDILIVDWDVHHGNGTQATFYDDPSVLYFSTHQYPFYPGTGSEMETGSGKGMNYNINVPLPIGSGDADYLRAFKEKLEPAALDFSPDFVLISAGFDAHKDDLLGGMKVTAEGFAQLTQIVKEISEKCCEGRLVSVLEGGYGLEGLAASVEAHIQVLTR
jgi:acetoin utilization deacetylase AcuC-like enzyme/formylglycine-generating enzyme required for sulfatase activity